MPKVKRPDWKNPNDYARMDDFTPSQWAWEFLRRNPEYVKAWERYCDAMYEITKDPDLSPVPDELVGAEEWGIANGYHDPEKDDPEIRWLPAAGIGFAMTIDFPPAKKRSRHTMGRIMPCWNM